jgi:hypothetical protein
MDAYSSELGPSGAPLWTKESENAGSDIKGVRGIMLKAV